MKTLELSITILLMLAISCTKNGINRPSQSTSNVSNSTKEASFTIGQNYQGGIIFYIDKTKQHGLIVSTADLLTSTENTQVAWKHGPNVITGASGIAVGTGASNTSAIVAAIGSKGQYAALLCSKYKVGIYQDWYLPSKNELNLLYAQKAVIPGLSATNYWSSSEVNKGKAWDQEFGGGFQFKDNKTFTLRVRAVHSF
jgi:uncharacterized protein DUF1566